MENLLPELCHSIFMSSVSNNPILSTIDLSFCSLVCKKWAQVIYSNLPKDCLNYYRLANEYISPEYCPKCISKCHEYNNPIMKCYKHRYGFITKKNLCTYPQNHAFKNWPRKNNHRRFMSEGYAKDVAKYTLEEIDLSAVDSRWTVEDLLIAFKCFKLQYRQLEHMNEAIDDNFKNDVKGYMWCIAKNKDRITIINYLIAEEIIDKDYLRQCVFEGEYNKDIFKIMVEYNFLKPTFEESILLSTDKKYHKHLAQHFEIL